MRGGSREQEVAAAVAAVGRRCRARARRRRGGERRALLGVVIRPAGISAAGSGDAAEARPAPELEPPARRRSSSTILPRWLAVGGVVDARRRRRAWSPAAGTCSVWIGRPLDGVGLSACVGAQAGDALGVVDELVGLGVAAGRRTPTRPGFPRAGASRAAAPAASGALLVGSRSAGSSGDAVGERGDERAGLGVALDGLAALALAARRRPVDLGAELAPRPRRAARAASRAASSVETQSSRL